MQLDNFQKYNIDYRKWQPIRGRTKTTLSSPPITTTTSCCWAIGFRQSLMGLFTLSLNFNHMFLTSTNKSNEKTWQVILIKWEWLICPYKIYKVLDADWSIHPSSCAKTCRVNKMRLKKTFHSIFIRLIRINIFFPSNIFTGPTTNE